MPLDIVSLYPHGRLLPLTGNSVLEESPDDLSAKAKVVRWEEADQVSSALVGRPRVCAEERLGWVADAHHADDRDAAAAVELKPSARSNGSELRMPVPHNSNIHSSLRRSGATWTVGVAETLAGRRRDPRSASRTPAPWRTGVRRRSVASRSRADIARAVFPHAPAVPPRAPRPRACGLQSPIRTVRAQAAYEPSDVCHARWSCTRR